MKCNNVQTWQKVRIQLNHDWLQNQFIPACAKMVHVLEGAVQDEAYGSKFFGQYLPVCVNRFKEIDELIASFEKSMSPGSLFEENPLNCLPGNQKLFFLELSHILWMHKNPVQKWISNAKKALAYSQTCWLNTQEKNKGFGDVYDVKICVSEFLESCIELSDCISLFPSKIIV